MACKKWAEISDDVFYSRYFFGEYRVSDWGHKNTYVSVCVCVCACLPSRNLIPVSRVREMRFYNESWKRSFISFSSPVRPIIYLEPDVSGDFYIR